MEDTIWALVMATQPAIVTLSTSNSSSQTFNVPAGVSKLSMPISAGGFMKGSIVRNGQTILELNPAQFSFSANPKTYNFNAFVASASTA
ncbi:hypothetical protein BDN72DRAFT_254871 [Pluteus cervinus]|uniref:Uncharacterized protein n=1 Tax=Pluteus cervinus TaxID=181527 RepID=A0ACD3AFV5_9AGAR|nr:hypothetical protein BDN72DRAFT_254871 [Pluteus cervinus]